MATCRGVDPGSIDIDSLLSVSNRPFQDGKICGKVVCSLCIESKEGVKFYFDDVGLKQHFKVKYRGVQFDDNWCVECKRQFRDLHGDETLNLVKRLSSMRLEMVCMYTLLVKIVVLSKPMSVFMRFCIHYNAYRSLISFLVCHEIETKCGKILSLFEDRFCIFAIID